MSREKPRYPLTRQDRIDYGLEERHNPRLEERCNQPWERIMTCCVAALCDKGKSIVLVADKMIGSGMIEGEPEITKILTFHRHWRVMLAGDDISPAFPIIDSVKQKLSRKRALAVRQVMDAFKASYRREREDIAESMYLSPRGWTMRSFNSAAAKILPKQVRKEISDKLQSQRLELSLLVAGFDNTGKGHIFSLDDYEHRGKPRRQDIPGFHAIGSGAPGAIYMMTYRDASASMPLRLMIYYALEGKYFGELAGGVGLRTDFYVLRSGKRTFKIKEETLDKKLFTLCKKIQPRNLTQSHVDALNSLRGAYLDQIPKLKTKRDNGELIIS